MGGGGLTSARALPGGAGGGAGARPVQHHWWECARAGQSLTHTGPGAQAAGLVGYRFNTIGVSDGISMGTDGMSFSLQSRDIIADSIETVMGAQVVYESRCQCPLTVRVNLPTRDSSRLRQTWF